MTRFLDGPAVGNDFELRRVPKFLRIVQSEGGIFSTLECVEDDAPYLNEKVFAYRLAGDGYERFPIQPPEPIMRNNKQWQDWCRAMNKVPTPKQCSCGYWLDDKGCCWRCCNRKCQQCGKGTGSAFILVCDVCHLTSQRSANEQAEV